jgi:ribose 5-phosphate isomerase A
MHRPLEWTSLIAQRALQLLKDGDVVGLGSGKAATVFTVALGERVKAGLRVRAVPTSEATARLAEHLGIPLASLDEGMPIDITFDGADEVDKDLNLIKGLGGALVREKIVATASRRVVILVGPEKIAEKLVSILGSRGVLPVEVVPFGLSLCRDRLSELACQPALRLANDHAFVTDNGNYILDCKVTPIIDPHGLEQQIRAIPGVVGTGLFLGIAHTVLIQEGETVKEWTRKP